MTIHRRDLPDAPYRIRKSDFNTQWVWYHFCGHPGSVGRAPTREQARDAAEDHARWHADTARPVDAILKLIRREIGPGAHITKVHH